MRVTLGRGDWRPGDRIEGLLRYAFIGNSTAYGAGVAPDQTLPAYAERQMNDLLPGWPVEAVNLGVSGYNLWNSWLAFRHGPQVYDGVVLVLCNNDAELFSRSYPFVYPKPHDPQWASSHPFGRAVLRCFDEIASFSREHSLPIAVVFFNMWQYQAGIGEVVGKICASRCLFFLDTFPLIRARNFVEEEMVVSKADFHPSALAHEAVGRHLAAMLRRQGWFEKYAESSVDAAFERVLSCTRTMIEKDHYPMDAALNWGLGVLETKSRLAHRMQALNEDQRLLPSAEHATETLSQASLRWHAAQRLSSFLKEATTRNHRIASSLNCAEEEKLKIDEIAFALGTGDWDGLAESSFDTAPQQQQITYLALSQELHFFEECVAELRRVRAAIGSLRALAAPAAIRRTHERPAMLANIRNLEQHVDRVREGILALQAAFERCDEALSGARAALPEGRSALAAGLLGASFRRARHSFGFVRYWAGVISNIRDLPLPLFTTIEVTLSTEKMEEKTFCLLTGEVEYCVPERLPFSTNGSFLADGLPMILKLRLPVMYAGRLILRTSFMRAPEKPPVEIKLIKIELYNVEGRRQIVDLSSLHKDSGGRFVSPPIYLS